MAWQTLRGPHEEAGNDLSQPAAVAAVLTSQRLLVLSPDLRILVAAPATERVTSCLWLGPALLYTTQEHQARPQLPSVDAVCHSASRVASKCSKQR